MNDYIVLLGSGKSILDLTLEEKQFITNQKNRIGINKYTYFWNDIGISPNKVFFIDDHDKTAKFYLHEIFKKVRRNELNIDEFILSVKSKKYLSRSLFSKKIKTSILKAILQVKYTLLKIFKISHYGRTKYFYKRLIRSTIYMIFTLKIEDLWRIKYVEKKIKLTYLKRSKVDDPNSKWAISLNEKHYNFRTSLCVLLNYISIKYPNQPILLVGVDLISEGHFYKHSTSIIHSSMNVDIGYNLDRKLPWISDQLRKTNNTLFTTSKKSLFYKLKLAKRIAN